MNSQLDLVEPDANIKLIAAVVRAIDYFSAGLFPSGATYLVVHATSPRVVQPVYFALCVSPTTGELFIPGTGHVGKIDPTNPQRNSTLTDDDHYMSSGLGHCAVSNGEWAVTWLPV